MDNTICIGTASISRKAAMPSDGGPLTGVHRMDIRITGIGPLDEAALTCDGLTVITGRNGTGKSTVQKLLYAVCEAACDLDQRIIDSIRSALIQIVVNEVRSAAGAQALADKDVEWISYLNGEGGVDRNGLSAIYRELRHRIEQGAFKPTDNTRQALSYIDKYFSSEDSRPLYYQQFLANNLLAEFDDQTVNLRHPAGAGCRISAEGRDGRLSFDARGQVQWDGQLPQQFSSVFYLDSPYTIDTLARSGEAGGVWTRMGRLPEHRAALVRTLRSKAGSDIIGQLVANDRSRQLEDILREVLKGSFRMENGQLRYQEDGLDLSAWNLATGMKTFSVIQLLLDRGLLGSRTLLLIDEPEVHLHPEWQLTYAQLLAMLVKCCGVNVVLTTHSFQFLASIQAFKQEYEVPGHFYSFERSQAGGGVAVRDVSDTLEEVYRPMAAAFDKADDLYWQALDRQG